MSRPLLPVAVALLALALSGCSGAPAPTVTVTVTADPTPTAEPISVASVMDSLPAAISEISTVTRITEDNDPNDMIGRPNGYLDGAVFADSRLTCDELGASCGATLEDWGTEEAARERSVYIQGILKDSPMLGSEYNYIVGGLLLRVSGELTPTDAKAYEAAFTEQ